MLRLLPLWLLQGHQQSLPAATVAADAFLVVAAAGDACV